MLEKCANCVVGVDEQGSCVHLPTCVVEEREQAAFIATVNDAIEQMRKKVPNLYYIHFIVGREDENDQHFQWMKEYDVVREL